MLETLWYMLVLAMQIVQTNPHVRTDQLQIDVFIASKSAYSLTVQGNAVQGQFVDAELRQVFGEFESTRRLPQAYVIFPRTALPPELEALAQEGKDKPKGQAAPAEKAGAKPEPKELIPFTIDYTKALKHLAPLSVKPRQSLEFTEKERFMGGGKDAKASPSPAAKTPQPSPAKSGAAAADAKASSSPSAKPDAEQPAVIEIRQYSNRLVLSADFAQILIVINYM